MFNGLPEANGGVSQLVGINGGDGRMTKEGDGADASHQAVGANNMAIRGSVRAHFHATRHVVRWQES